MVALSLIPYSWMDWTPEACRLRNCYCEPFRTGYFVLQPFTAFSNLGYILAGLFVLSRVNNRTIALSLPFNPMRNDHAWGIGYGVCLLVTGWFSFFSHASLTRVGEWFDLMGVYTLLSFLIAYNFRRLGSSHLIPILLFSSVLVVLGFQMVFVPEWQQTIITVLVFGTISAEVLAKKVKHPESQTRLLLLAIALFATGASIWAVNGRVPICHPGEFPWHIAWHLLSAGAALVLFQYFWKEHFETVKER